MSTRAQPNPESEMQVWVDDTKPILKVSQEIRAVEKPVGKEATEPSKRELAFHALAEALKTEEQLVGLKRLLVRVNAWLEGAEEGEEFSQGQALLLSVEEKIGVAQKSEPVVETSAKTTTRLKPLVNTNFDFLNAASSGSSAPKKVVLGGKPAKKWGEIKTDQKQEEKPEPDEVISERVVANFNQEPSPKAKSAAMEVAKKKGTCEISSKNIELLDADRMKGSSTIAGKGGPEKAEEAKRSWKAADGLIQQAAEDLRAAKEPPTGGGLLALMIEINKKLTPGAKSGKFREEDRGGGLLPFKLIEKELGTYCGWLAGAIELVVAGKANPVEIAAAAYQRLNGIHPFGDANGRVCQMVMDMVLQAADMLPANLNGELIDPIPVAMPPSDGTALLPTKALDAVTRAVERSYQMVNAAEKREQMQKAQAENDRKYQEALKRDAELAANQEEIHKMEAELAVIEDKILELTESMQKKRPEAPEDKDPRVIEFDVLSEKRRAKIAKITEVRLK